MTDPLTLRKTGCPVAYLLDIIGDKWSLLIIRDIMIHGKSTAGEFLASDEKIASNILNDRLKKLVAAGVLEKKKNPNNWRSYIYSLTPKGRDLAPIIIEMVRWSGVHDSRSIARKGVFERLTRDRAGLETEMRSAG